MPNKIATLGFLILPYGTGWAAFNRHYDLALCLWQKRKSQGAIDGIYWESVERSSPVIQIWIYFIAHDEMSFITWCIISFDC